MLLGISLELISLLVGIQTTFGGNPPVIMGFGFIHPGSTLQPFVTPFRSAHLARLQLLFCRGHDFALFLRLISTSEHVVAFASL